MSTCAVGAGLAPARQGDRKGSPLPSEKIRELDSLKLNPFLRASRHPRVSGEVLVVKLPYQILIVRLYTSIPRLRPGVNRVMSHEISKIFLEEQNKLLCRGAGFSPEGTYRLACLNSLDRPHPTFETRSKISSFARRQ
jgi:hypothetical protein